MNRTVSVELKDATNKVFPFTDIGELLKFLNMESVFWANTKSRHMVGVDDNEVHEYINSRDSRFEPCISNIEEIYKLRGSRTRDFSDKITEILQAHLGSHWLWSRHDYTTAFIKVNSVLGLHPADAFIQIVIASGNLNNEFETFKSKFEAWGGDAKQNWDDLLDTSSQAHSDQQQSHGKAFEKFLEESESGLNDLKMKYEEDLRYSPSVKYWQDAGKEYKAQGKRWVDYLIVTLVAGLICFTILFDTWLEGQAIAVELDTVQGVILFGTVLAIFAFLVRTLSRLTFSAYHLMRDAGERELLTHLYLSLINEKKMDESSRDIILQALFSRTETGLLTGDSSPTMPNLSVEAMKSAMKQTGN